jgi:hypothetical protein
MDECTQKLLCLLDVGDTWPNHIDTRQGKTLEATYTPSRFTQQKLSFHEAGFENRVTTRRVARRATKVECMRTLSLIWNKCPYKLIQPAAIVLGLEILEIVGYIGYLNRLQAICIKYYFFVKFLSLIERGKKLFCLRFKKKKMLQQQTKSVLASDTRNRNVN